MTKRSIPDLLEHISLDLGQLARDASWERSMGLEAAYTAQEAAFNQSIEMGLMQTDLQLAIDDLRWEVTNELQRQIDVLKASQLPPIEAEVRELMNRARDNEKHSLYQEALEDLLRAEEKQPYDYRLQDWIGTLYLQRFNDPSTAIGHFDKAVRYATPRSSKAGAWELLGRSRCKMALRDVEGAYKDTKEALKLDDTRAPLLYEHAVHAAQVGEIAETLSTLEKAIEQAPIYWLAAAEDKRFSRLGSSLSELLETLQTDLRGDIDSLLAQSQAFEHTVSGWKIPAREFGPERYDELWLPLAEAETALDQSYPHQASALESARQGLPKLILWVNEQVTSNIAKTEKAISKAHDQAEEAKDEARSALLDSLGLATGLLGYAAMLIVAYLMLRWGIDLVRLEDLWDVFLDLFKLCAISFAGLIAYFAVPRLIKQFRATLAKSAYRSRLQDSAKQYSDDASGAEQRLRALQTQRESLKPHIRG